VGVSELVWSDGLLVEARQALSDVAAALASQGVDGVLELTGGASVPGALTKGDIDLHLRVEPDAFSAVVVRLKAAYPVASAHSWAPTLAVFDIPAHRPTGLAVTPIGSEHDQRFRFTWQALRRDPALLDEYNALKKATVNTAEYEHRKSAFFTTLAAEGASVQAHHNREG
jgi:GrpB-like predicted nucleotidyltransferase (UPF0157 family)